MSTLYIEAFSGLSGDMFLSALAGLTDAYEELKSLPEKLHLQDGKIEIHDVLKNGMYCKHVNVTDLGHHQHESKHSHAQHHHGHGRHLSDIIALIDAADITEEAKSIAKAIFLIIGKAESKIHNIPLEKIHFHEISGVDSIIDIVGSAVLISKLKITKTYSTAICTGFGFVNTQHGKLPVPAPATAEILAGIPVYAGEEEGERVTPTGAAILKYLAPDFDIPVLTSSKTVYGPGKKDFIAPNLLRISLVKEADTRAEIFTMECNIDDMPGEFLGNDFQSDLLKSGAVDFSLLPVQMKKGRPGLLLSCLVKKNDIEKLSDFILENTTSIGVRYFPVMRKILQREIKNIETKYGQMKVKVVVTPGGQDRYHFEYEDLQRMSRQTKIPLVKLQQELLKIINLNPLSE